MSATSRKAHPRSRGENSVADTEIATHRGSSPLTRGKLPGENDSRAWAGLIPAHAGKTITWLAQLITSWAHPRSRGENVRRAQYPPPTGGSSPLTRGKRAACEDRDFRRRLIPAHAGKTRRRTLSRRCPRAHPRSRGENFRLRCGQVGACGSSPLTRGKRGVEHDVRLTIRLIPAHAGKTSTSWTKTPPSGAHPRSRGENSMPVKLSRPPPGSSPLTRGKPGQATDPRDRCGLIPAHAGKTGARSGPHCAQRAHPRSRGENPGHSTKKAATRGSSPLTRGKHLATDTLPGDSGLIPAHAGKTPRD